MKKIVSFALVVVLLVLSVCTVVSCGKTKNISTDYTESDEATDYVLINVKNYGGILIKLSPDIAPITAENFKKLVSEKFYDGLTFHRVSKDFMIQGGDPNGDGTGGSGKTIKGEFSANGVTNNLSHTRGVISMARGSNSMDSASSQFFIVHQDSTFLDGQYAAFGKVIDGMDTVDAIANCKVQRANMWAQEVTSPVEKIVIKSVKFVTVNGEVDTSFEDVAKDGNAPVTE